MQKWQPACQKSSLMPAVTRMLALEATCDLSPPGDNMQITASASYLGSALMTEVQMDCG